MNEEGFEKIVNSYPALRENFEIQRAYIELKNSYSDFVIKQPELWLNNENIPRIIWWCWLQGEENSPEICKVSLASLKKYYYDCEIIILTKDNIDSFVALPKYIEEKYASGNISSAHYSDILRTFLLCKYGGVWIDATVLCTGRDNVIFEGDMFAFKHALRGLYGIVSSSWLLSAIPRHPILLLTRDLLCSYWRCNDTLFHYFLFHMFLTLAAEKYADIWNNIPLFSNVPPHILQYELGNTFSEKRFSQIKKMSNFHKLTYRVSELVKRDKTFYNYIIKSGR